MSVQSYLNSLLHNESIEDGETATFVETSNADVINMFIDNSFPKDKKPVWGTTNLKITKENDGWSLVNYRTRILYRPESGRGLLGDNPVYFNTTKYSVTTSKIQNQIRRTAADSGVELKETDEKGINDAASE